MPLARRAFNFLRHFLRFGFAGALVAVVQSGGYLLLVHLGWAEPMMANVLAFIPATAIAFAVHYSWTFRSAHAPSRAIWRFSLAKLLGLGLNSAGVFLVKDVLELSHYFVLPIMMLATPLTVFTISKYWAFRDLHHYHPERGAAGRG